MKNLDWRFDEVSNFSDTTSSDGENSVDGSGVSTITHLTEDSKIQYSDLIKYSHDTTYQIDHISISLGYRPFIIIGDDNRTPVFELEYPYNCICLLIIRHKDNSESFGTGFLISKRCIVTSGHCVFSGGDWAKEITVIPGARGNVAPFGLESSKKFKSVKGWTKKSSDNFDHGAIILPNDTLFNSVGGYLGFKILENENAAEVSGYPIDKSRTQWKGAGKILKKSKFRIYYDVDTLEGNSGSPIFIRNGKSRRVIGIHSDGSNPNYAVRLREEIIDHWKKWSTI